MKDYWNSFNGLHGHIVEGMDFLSTSSFFSSSRKNQQILFVPSASLPVCLCEITNPIIVTLLPKNIVVNTIAIEYNTHCAVACLTFYLLVH